MHFREHVRYAENGIKAGCGSRRDSCSISPLSWRLLPSLGAKLLHAVQMTARAVQSSVTCVNRRHSDQFVIWGRACHPPSCATTCKLGALSRRCRRIYLGIRFHLGVTLHFGFPEALPGPLPDSHMLSAIRLLLHRGSACELDFYQPGARKLVDELL